MAVHLLEAGANSALLAGCLGEPQTHRPHTVLSPLLVEDNEKRCTLPKAVLRHCTTEPSKGASNIRLICRSPPFWVETFLTGEECSSG